MAGNATRRRSGSAWIKERLLLNGSGGHPHPEREAPIIDRTPTVPELQRITELANEYRRQLMADLASEFPGDASAAMAVALAIMSATSMTPDPARQSDQARILNEILSRWQPVLPWQLVRRAN